MIYFIGGKKQREFKYFELLEKIRKENVGISESFFDVDLSILHHQSNDERLIFGQRVYVRFDLGHAPFAWQLILRLKQLFLKELHV